MKKCISCSHHYMSEVWLCPRCNVVPAMSDGFMVFSPELAFENSGFSGNYFEYLAKLEGGSFWFRSRNPLIPWFLHNYFPSTRNFFELGCDNGKIIIKSPKDQAVTGTKPKTTPFEFGEILK